MMTLKKQIPAIWVYTTGDAFNATQGDGLAFLTKQEQARLERIRQARMLFRSEHRKYFLEEGRTQYSFPPLRVGGGREITFYIPLNVLRLISYKGADLMFGQEPLVRVDDAAQQEHLSEMAERTHLHDRLYSAAVDCSYEGETFIEACRKDGLAYLRVLDAADMFPQGEVGPDDQYPAYVRRQIEEVPGSGGEGKRPIHLLLETTYLAGSIERRLWQLDENDKKRLELQLKNWPVKPIGEDVWQPVTKTGIRENTITWIPNATDHGTAVSDYDGLIEEQDALNEANTRMKRVLYKHGNPKIFFPSGAADSTGNISAQDDAFYGGQDEKPEYITWDAQLDAASKDRSFSLNILCIRAETSPVLLGLKEGAAPDAYRKLRLEAQNSLTKAQRKATKWKPGIRRALSVAAALEQSSAGAISYEALPPLAAEVVSKATGKPAVGGAVLPAVEMRDGIPVDELDQANTISTLMASHAMSRRRALELQLGDSDAVEKELAEIQDEVNAATPSVLLSEPGARPPVGEPASAGGPAVGTGEAA